MPSAICPYPGLRPFTEEESIFFKGRDLHIEQVTKQLEQKKFVMLTGASGDGKSSLIYAGVIPNARAGFFKAKYNNWLFVTFRPERSPLDNFATAVAQQMNLNYEDARKELGFGFSSLVNLYKTSSFFLDQNSESFKNADETEKKKLKRKAANLFILIDQFEEFFTNPENYSQGIPSNDSQTVINLLLETAKIALEQNLPIYIVCTMRSDYIGQCAAFRGLPEMIGFSQFFVPRLKRKEIYQVIEEPATLAGCKISQRLVEHLINGMNEGFDQLPVLQHALNGIWNEAHPQPLLPKGGEKKVLPSVMDLIHLAKITGLSSSLLPENEKAKFNEWFAQLPESRKKHFNSFGLEKVLGTHADTLYETAHEYYNERHLSSPHLGRIEEGLSQHIIKIAFQCLTRIDASRAVRNRMTMQEITDIIKPSLALPKGGDSNAQAEEGADGLTIIVGNVLNIFREQGNTLISPFINNEKPESRNLKPYAVLDITHESLIRNWRQLGEWAQEEYDNFLTWQDFARQLQRWMESGKSAGYLLPIGPLTFFEKWFNTKKPNKYWLARYGGNWTCFILKGKDGKPCNDPLKQADETLAQAREFIKKSARKLFVTRTVMHYGANKVAAFFAILALVITCTYYYFDFRKKQNDAVIETVEDRGLELLFSSKVKTKAKAAFVINYERLHNGTFQNILNGLEDTLAFEIATEAFWLAQNFSPAERENDSLNTLAYPLLQYMNKRLQNLINLDVYHENRLSEENHKRLNQFLRTCVYVRYYDNSHEIKELISQNLWRLNDFVTATLNLPPPADSIKVNAQQLLTSVELLLSLADDNKLYAISSLTEKISPFENEEAKNRFNKIFPKEQSIKVDWNNNLSHNGGYQMLSYLYASTGNSEKIENCLDSILVYNKDYKIDEYENFYDILAFLAKFNYLSSEKSEQLLMQYQKAAQISYSKLFEKIKAMTVSQFHDQKITYKNFTPTLIKYQLHKIAKDKIWDYYKVNLVKSVNDKDELNFKFAMYYKKIGVYASLENSQKEKSDFYFSKAFEHFALVSNNYCNKDFIVGTEGSTEAVSIINSALFLYPAIIDEDYYWNPFYLNMNNKGFLSFADYISDNELLYHYKSSEDFDAIEKFLYQYFYQFKVNNWEKRDTINYSYFDYTRIMTVSNKTAEDNIDKNFLELVIINKSFEEKNITKAMNMYEKLNFQKVLSPDFQTGKNPKDEVNVYLLKNLATNLAMQGKNEDAFKIIHFISKPHDRRNTLIDIADKIQKSSSEENTFIYLDSLFKEIGTENKFGLKFLQVLGMAGSQPVFDISINLIKDVSDNVKPRALTNFIRGILHNNFYYKAYTYIPDYISSANELELYNEILNTKVNSKKDNIGWRKHYKITLGENEWSGDYERGDDFIMIGNAE